MRSAAAAHLKVRAADRERPRPHLGRLVHVRRHGIGGHDSAAVDLKTAELGAEVIIRRNGYTVTE